MEEIEEDGENLLDEEEVQDDPEGIADLHGRFRLLI